MSSRNTQSIEKDKGCTQIILAQHLTVQMLSEQLLRSISCQTPFQGLIIQHLTKQTKVPASKLLITGEEFNSVERERSSKYPNEKYSFKVSNILCKQGFPNGSVGRESACNAGDIKDAGLTFGSGGSGERDDNFSVLA